MSASKDSWVLIGKDGRAHDLPPGMIFIGREECEIILQAVTADKRHAVVYYNLDEKEYLIKDLNSLTGTYVNGIRIPEQTYVKLKHLDCIRFGYGPDAFYLEKSATSHLNNLGKEKIETRELKEQQSPVESRTLQNSTISSTSPLHKTENQPFNRTDLPPDSLPLNLNNHDENSRSWCDTEGNLSDSPDYSQRSESSSCSAPANVGRMTNPDHEASSTHSSPAAMAFTVAFENEVATPRKKLGIRDSIRKFAPNKAEGETRTPFQKNCKTEPSPKKYPPEEVKAPILPVMKQATNICQEQNDNSKIQDAASFLIKKMLNTQLSDSILENDVEVDKHETELPPLNDANDDRSEAGTYTVEAENNDCDVEEARKRIDEVFGVIQLSNQAQLVQTSNTVPTSTSTNKQIPCLSGRMKQNLSKQPVPLKQRAPCEAEPSQLWGRTNRGANRGKRLIPGPSNPDVSACGDRLPIENSSLQRARRTSDPPPTPEKARRAKMASSPKSPGVKGKAISTLKSTGIPTNNLSALPVERSSTTASDDSSHHRSSDNRSEGSKSPHSTSGQWRKVPWNLSGSDVELDQSKSENNSVISDTSTEPSSHSSHSGKNKPDHGPQMRLNRAFALRRARLEADTAKRGKENKVLTGSQKAMKKSGKLSASTTALREESTCSGKTSYRLTAAIAKPVPGKPAVRVADVRSEAFRNRKPDMKSCHRRIESDPGKGIPVWRMDPRPATAGSAGGFVTACSRGSLKTTPTFPTDVNNLQSFHRSMSCSVMNDTDIPIPNVPYNFVRSFEHSVISGSQIVTGQNIDEFHIRKHPNKELTALDCLVISAIHQLSSKLWTTSKALLEKQREKCTKGSDSWLMIEEVLPNMPVAETPEDGDLTKDLSTILKNLKKVEQALEILACTLDSENIAEPSTVEKKPPLPQNFFIVDM